MQLESLKRMKKYCKFDHWFPFEIIFCYKKITAYVIHYNPYVYKISLKIKKLNFYNVKYVYLLV